MSLDQNKKQRYCLKCNKKFLSTWAGNRICPSCSALKRDTYMPVRFVKVKRATEAPPRE